MTMGNRLGEGDKHQLIVQFNATNHFDMKYVSTIGSNGLATMAATRRCPSGRRIRSS
ncbi:MAG: hypothetical protein KGM49_01425 [Sphingomonadales bacterium]|nr:hypothetical protein [Sphingomonadales bacterium]